jgi:hypothetical protein
MARADAISLLYSQRRSGFDFDQLSGPYILNLLSPYDLQMIEDINNDPRLNTKLKERLNYVDNIMRARGFRRMTQGTNRACYKYYEDQSFIFKVAISKPGFNDSPRELRNQHLLKPFVAKCFDVSPSGMVGSFERVQDITSTEQFKSVANDVFTLLNDHIIGKYVMADIGTKYFRNYGLRLGFGPVLLDYPMLFEVDGDKLFCKAIDRYTGQICDGQIDYDAGFNNLYCEKCGRMYLANELEKKITTGDIIRAQMESPLRSKRRNKMKIVISEGEKQEVIQRDTTSSNIYVQKQTQPKKKGIIITDGDKVMADIEVDSKKEEEPVQVQESTQPEESTTVNEMVQEKVEEPKEEPAKEEEKIEGPAEDTGGDDETPAEDISDEEEEESWVKAPSNAELRGFISSRIQNAEEFMDKISEELMSLRTDAIDEIESYESLIHNNLASAKLAISENSVPEYYLEEYEKATSEAINNVAQGEAQSPEELNEVIKGKVSEDFGEDY